MKNIKANDPSKDPYPSKNPPRPFPRPNTIEDTVKQTNPKVPVGADTTTPSHLGIVDESTGPRGVTPSDHRGPAPEVHTKTIYTPIAASGVTTTDSSAGGKTVGGKRIDDKTADPREAASHGHNPVIKRLGDNRFEIGGQIFTTEEQAGEFARQMKNAGGNPAHTPSQGEDVDGRKKDQPFTPAKPFQPFKGNVDKDGNKNR